MKFLVFFTLSLISLLAAEPEKKADAKDLPALIRDLGADAYKTRKKAKEQLLLLGESVVPELKKVLSETEDPELIANIKEVLFKLKNFRGLVNGKWKGTWESENSPGYLFSYVMTVNLDEKYELKGQIEWKLLKAPDNRKIGETAIEHIEGKGDEMTRLLDFKGVRKDDPVNIISLDSYKIPIGEFQTEFTGKTSSRGSWKGVLTGKKISEE